MFLFKDRHQPVAYNDVDIKSYCGNCQKQFEAELFYCPTCKSNLVNYNTGLPTEKFAVQDRWERHNRNFHKSHGYHRLNN